MPFAHEKVVVGVCVRVGSCNAVFIQTIIPSYREHGHGHGHGHAAAKLVIRSSTSALAAPRLPKKVRVARLFHFSGGKVKYGGASVV